MSPNTDTVYINVAAAGAYLSKLCDVIFGKLIIARSTSIGQMRIPVPFSDIFYTFQVYIFYFATLTKYVLLY